MPKLKEKHKYRDAYKTLTLYATKYPGEHAPARSFLKRRIHRQEKAKYGLTIF
jgi:hypothetical protein